MRRQHGAAAVEFSLVIFFLLMILFGITEFGRALFVYDTLTKSVRSGARHLATTDPSSAARRTEAANLALCGQTTCGGGAVPVVGGLSAGNVTVQTFATDDGLRNIQTGEGTLNLVTVTIAGYAFESIVPFGVPSFTFGPISATMPR